MSARLALLVGLFLSADAGGSGTDFPRVEAARRCQLACAERNTACGRRCAPGQDACAGRCAKELAKCTAPCGAGGEPSFRERSVRTPRPAAPPSKKR